MPAFDDLKTRYDDYYIFCDSLYEKYSPAAGLLGLGNSPKNDPGHDTFYDDVKNLVDDFLKTSPDEESVYEWASFIIKAADARRSDDMSFWFLFAAQAHAMPLIPLLSDEHRAELRKWYDAHHEKVERMPVQNKLYKLLKGKKLLGK